MSFRGRRFPQSQLMKSQGLTKQIKRPSTETERRAVATSILCKMAILQSMEQPARKNTQRFQMSILWTALSKEASAPCMGEPSFKEPRKVTSRVSHTSVITYLRHQLIRHIGQSNWTKKLWNNPKIPHAAKIKIVLTRWDPNDR